MIIKNETSSAAERFDRIALHPALGPLLFLIMWAGLLHLLFNCCQPVVDALEQGIHTVRDTLRGMIGASLLSSLLLDGVLTGIGSVIALTPPIAALLVCLNTLRCTGYLARGSRLLQHLLRRVGLPPQAAAAMTAGFACAVPAMLALRNIPSRKQRLIALFVTPFLPCSARLPVYSLLIAAWFAHAPPLLGVINAGSAMLIGLYALGIAATFGTAYALKHCLQVPTAPLFTQEALPPYRFPALVPPLRTTACQVWIFWRDAGKIIIAASIVLWGLFTFPRHSDAIDTFQLEHSYAGRLGKVVQPVFAPLGFDWRICVSLLASFAAREAFIPTYTIASGPLRGFAPSPESSSIRSGGPFAAKPSGDEELTRGEPQDVLSWVPAGVFQVGAGTIKKGDQNETGPRGDPHKVSKNFVGENRAVPPAPSRKTLAAKPPGGPLTGLSLLVFFALSMQCVSTFATCKQETNSWGWALGQWGTMTFMAWLAAFAVYQLGLLAGLG
ncbi:MAG: nucleoside recognition domain-containing protein [Myxococcota bacterium]